MNNQNGNGDNDVSGLGDKTMRKNPHFEWAYAKFISVWVGDTRYTFENSSYRFIGKRFQVVNYIGVKITFGGNYSYAIGEDVIGEEIPE